MKFPCSNHFREPGMRGFVLEKWAIGSLKESRAQNIARKPVWPQKKSYVHVFRNKHTCIDYCRGKVLRIYWYILSALTIYIDVTSPSFCGRSQLCNDPDTYQALGSVERRQDLWRKIWMKESRCGICYDWDENSFSDLRKDVLFVICYQL